ncbi:GlxA family transcriptional regulator [Vitiosangium sp. GDMCC 1.1324]|uniref:GlxA family transcriptional regulator n=1 Tax=Vitiosangium sp. (strain GDMCC 1.1324) TaxID=2138576 RepID=UPI000D3D5C79|nr:helix-turn-helix domain-containing protein [Vitiosangium sp. GDMCC 1.1324]PTL81158.1 AraC family transcriptional regulator [Vitiosangium sp. GDMCC 1.1324]
MAAKTATPRILPSARGRRNARAARTVALVAFDGVHPLDITGPASVFGAASFFQPGAYQVLIASPRGGSLATASAVALADTVALARLPRRLDTVLVAGGSEDALYQAILGDGVGAWLAKVAPSVRRIGSVCTGAFALAAAGLLDGRRATTHWRACGLLQELVPSARVEPDAIHTLDGPICTSAGVTAGIDLALALVEQDLGRAVAAEVARELVVFLRRPGGQSQFSEGLAAQAGTSDRMGELITWMVEHPDADLSVPALAARAAMSERNFARVFARETGQTPARFAEQARLERARFFLETSDGSLEQIAAQSGFGSLDALQRAFRRHLRVTPAAYRARFSAPRRRS